MCENVVNSAIKRASKWISYQLSAEDGQVMVGQVGGISVHKRPLLTLEPDYVMKPVQTDHRGMREIFLYEAVKVLSKNKSSQIYAALLTGGTNKKLKQSVQQSNLQPLHASGFTELFDTLALWLAMKVNDPIVVEHEQRIKLSWRTVKKEIDTLRRLATFTPPYYGVVGQRSPLSMPKGEEQAHKHYYTVENGAGDILTNQHYGISLEAHLLLTDITANFSKPCVLDIKMGTQSYEPDAPEGKKRREIAKYPQQTEFGFRISGMRFYDPTHADADETGFRYFDKYYGRTLETTEALLEAIRLYFSAECIRKTDADVEDAGSGVTTIACSEGGRRSPNPSGVSGGMPSYAEERVRIRSISSLLAQLRPIQGFFEENKSLKFYSSSLLIVYEGDKNSTNPDMAVIKMIDFGRVRREPGGDEGYRLGLKKLKSLIDTILKEEKQWVETH